MSLVFDDRFVRALPGDPDDTNRTRQVSQACYSRVAPTPVRAPRLIAGSPEVAAMLGVSFTDEMIEALAGNALLPGMVPYAARYGGHQFGSWAGQLGDGRAITLGEVVSPSGRLELQLKGAGRTPYSRSGDGRAVMRSSVRELLCSEAMHHLGVPTTRALSLVATGESVVRDVLYDGNARPEPGAIVCRVAPTFLRFGNFEILAARRETELLRRLVDDTITTHFPELGAPSPSTYAAWVAEIARRTAVMVVHWTRVGFVHGVMNTDNMSILGLTIDYGPYGWLEGYDPSWTPNTTDAAGRRYRFGQQPLVAGWNLSRFASAIATLVGDVAPLQDALDGYEAVLEREHRAMLAAKLGLRALDEEDLALVDALQAVLTSSETDMTIFYRQLAELETERDLAPVDDAALVSLLAPSYYAPDEARAHEARTAAWLRRYAARVRRDGRSDRERREAMNRVNPRYVLRNYMAQLAIDEAEKGDGALVMELLDLLRRPYDQQPARDTYYAKRPEWARHRVGCSMLSCSS